MLTGAQIRSARAALRWTAAQLAAATGISVQTVMRLEAHNGVPPSRSSSLSAIEAAFEAAGIEFIGTPDDGPGIRVRPTRLGDRPA
jgi:transcriptional regulator with XRE-family HTH domain